MYVDNPNFEYYTYKDSFSNTKKDFDNKNMFYNKYAVRKRINK